MMRPPIEVGIVASEGRSGSQHRCELCGTAFWFVRQRILRSDALPPDIQLIAGQVRESSSVRGGAKSITPVFMGGQWNGAAPAA